MLWRKSLKKDLRNKLLRNKLPPLRWNSLKLTSDFLQLTNSFREKRYCVVCINIRNGLLPHPPTKQQTKRSIRTWCAWDFIPVLSPCFIKTSTLFSNNSNVTRQKVSAPMCLRIVKSKMSVCTISSMNCNSEHLHNPRVHFPKEKIPTAQTLRLQSARSNFPRCSPQFISHFTQGLKIWQEK